MNSIITRFAPSPTGNLHIGGIRTALINYIVVQQSKKINSEGKFLLRIEDTDKKRSKNEFKENIISGLGWMGIKYDEEIFIQSERLKRHQDVAYELLKKGNAFKCICTQETLEIRRAENKKNKANVKKLCSECEDNQEIQKSNENNYTIRIRIPNSGQTKISDLIQQQVSVENTEIDNFILLRKDKTPTYMLSVVVDDHDMDVNLIIRGDDHLNNAFRQIFIYKKMNWQIPTYAHIPLIHGEDGKKLSKRHGSVDINEFKNQGYLKESIINSLILLGWAPTSNNENIEIDEIINLFDLKKMSKSSSIFNYDKLNFFNNHYIKKKDINLSKLFNFCKDNYILKKYISLDKDKFIRIFHIYKKNLKYYKELEDICINYYQENFLITKKELLNDNFNSLIIDFNKILEEIADWNFENLEKNIKNFIALKKIKFYLFGKPSRLLLINIENGPSIGEILYILGKKNSIQRIKNYISTI